MRAVTFDPDTDRFSLREIAPPAPGPGEVRVRVAACGLNPVDAKLPSWKAMALGMTADWVPGLDVSGRIDALGPGVEHWRVGDAVLYHGDMLSPHGGLAELAIHPAATLLAHPRLPPVIAASLPCSGWVAWRALVDKLRLAPGDSLLVLGGSGGVGGFAVQLARLLGARPIIAVCSRANHACVLSHGATHAIDYRSEDVARRVCEITGGYGVTRAIDAVGWDADLAAVECLAFEGELVELVDLARPHHYRDAYGRGLSFHQLALGAAHRHGEAARRRLLEVGREVCGLAEAGVVRATVARELELADVPAALHGLLGERLVGKTVAILSPNALDSSDRASANAT